MIGSTISHYKILEKLGEGGMGVVYKAHDTTLDRDVAIKFLPSELSASEKENLRFLHEAKAASALDHPNICTIYEAGLSPDGRTFIAMGYYQGTVLSRKIEKGPLDLSEAVGIAIQIAEGLQAAHEKGIVHRDIKASNIMVTDKGQVKILDFGLARKRGMTKLTRTGTTVGTASYMSPEQARGESIDQRTDIWSLGVVLYEMITGKLPFKGEHEAAVLYCVVNEEPQPIQVIVSDASPELIHILRWALEKDPAERYQSAADLLTDLRRLKKDTSRTGFAPVNGQRRKPFLVRKWRLIAAGVLVLLCVVGYLSLMKRGVEINTDIKVRPLQTPAPVWASPGLSGDGNWIAFTAKDDSGRFWICQMHSSGGEPRRVAPVPTWGMVDVSPDGSLIAVNIVEPQNGNVWNEYTVTSNGGTLRRIFQGVNGRFRPDGRRIGYMRGVVGDQSPSGKAEFWSAGTDGSDPRREFIDSVHSGDAAAFAYAPNGKKVAWVRFFREGYSEIVIHDLETGEEHTITSDRALADEPVWAREDQIIYVTDKSGVYNLWMVSAGGGTPVPITKESTPVTSPRCSADGKKLLYSTQIVNNDFWMVDLEKNRSKQISLREDNQHSPKFSPNGKEIAFIVGGFPGGPSSVNTSSHLFVMDREGGNRKQLSFGDEYVFDFSWSPDGRHIAYGSRKISEPADSFRTYLIEPSNLGSLRYITHGIPEGEWIDSVRLQVTVNNNVYAAPINGAPPTKVYDDSTHAVFIQGGKYIVFYDLRQGRNTSLWIVDGTKPRNVQRKTARRLPWSSNDFSTFIRISGDGKVLYAFKGKGEIWRMTLPDGKEERIGANLLGVRLFVDFSPSWDGKEMVIIINNVLSNLVMVENLFK